MNNHFGLKKEDIDMIISILSQHPEVEEACIFGSRAKGNYRVGSDVDIALKGQKLNFDIMANISYLLNEETNMPYRFDVLNYDTLPDADLLDHIKRIGMVFYKQPTYLTA